jgi:hypothetical protein
LDKNSVTIRYNILNLPETIQFGNGRQIINSYDAGGHKLTTQYYTLIGTVIVTQGNIHGSYTTANSVLRWMIIVAATCMRTEPAPAIIPSPRY